MKRLALLGMLCAVVAVFVGPVGGAHAEEQTWQEICSELEASARAATEGASFANMTTEQKAAYITEAVAPCRAEQAKAEADQARRDAEEAQREEREAGRRAEREAERREHKRQREREEATRIRRSRHHICMKVPGRDGCWVRPHEMLYGAHASIYGIHWRSWGPHRAIGIGHILWRHTASEPHFGPYRAKLVLTLPGECSGAVWYTRRSLIIKHRDVLERNESFGPCSGS